MTAGPIERGWASYLEVEVNPSLPAEQVAELKHCFYWGALKAMQMLSAEMNKGRSAREVGEEILRDVAKVLLS